ncbi:MAG: hypothetical protein ACR2PY_00285 [Salinispira sp.]
MKTHKVYSNILFYSSWYVYHNNTYSCKINKNWVIQNDVKAGRDVTAGQTLLPDTLIPDRRNSIMKVETQKSYRSP